MSLFKKKSSNIPEMPDDSPFKPMMDLIQEKMDNTLKEITIGVAEFQKELDSLSPKAWQLYDKMCKVHTRILNEQDRFEKNYDYIKYWKFRDKYKALYRKILDEIWTDEMGEIINDKFEALDAYIKVKSFTVKYEKKIPHKDLWQLESISGFTPYGYLSDLATNKTCELNGLVMERLKSIH